jgi:hypothetical protein
MHGELIAAWTESKSDIWDALAKAEDSPNDLYCELYRCASRAFKVAGSSDLLAQQEQKLAETLGDAELAKTAFTELSATEFSGERQLRKFFEEVYEELDSLYDTQLANIYLDLLKDFVRKYNIRYEIVAPCQLVPSLTGIFSGLVSEIAALTDREPHLEELMNAFRKSIQDFRFDSSEDRIKTSIQKQFNLLEGIGRRYPGVTKGDLGSICDQIGCWPHSQVKNSISNLYTFACDYPGIRHGGRHESKKRSMETRDLVAMVVLLTGFLPYLSDDIDSDAALWRR